MSSSLSPADRKTVTEVRNYARSWEFNIEGKQKKFKDKGCIGLRWDSKQASTGSRFPWISFKSSDKNEVISHMEKYKAFYEEIADLFGGQLDKCSRDFYDRVIAMNDKLERLIKEAETEKGDTTSSAVYNMLKEFIANRCQLDHTLKKGECIALSQKVLAVEEACARSERCVEELNTEMKRVIEENRASAVSLRSQQAEADIRYQSLLEESNERIRKLQEESNRRLEAMQESTNRRMEALQEENRRTLQLIIQFMNMNVQPKPDSCNFPSVSKNSTSSRSFSEEP